MKKLLIFALALVMLAGILTACSGTASIDPYYGYSNVSTTDDGRVNGTNGASDYGSRRSYSTGDYNTTGRSGSSYNSTNGTARSYNSTNGTTRTNSGTYTGTASGTGMAGGR